MGTAPRWPGGDSLKVQEYIRVQTVSTSGTNASIRLDYYKNGEQQDSVTVVFNQSPNRSFHFVKVEYSTVTNQYWTITSNAIAGQATISGSNALVSNNAFTQVSWYHPQSRNFVVYKYPKAEKIVGQKLSI